MLQNAIISAGSKREEPERNPNRWRKPKTSVRNRGVTKAKLVASWLMSFWCASAARRSRTRLQIPPPAWRIPSTISASCEEWVARAPNFKKMNTSRDRTPPQVSRSLERIRGNRSRRSHHASPHAQEEPNSTPIRFCIQRANGCSPTAPHIPEPLSRNDLELCCAKLYSFRTFRTVALPPASDLGFNSG